MSSEPSEAIYDLAYEAFKRAPLGSSIVRAIVDAVWPLAEAAGRRKAAVAIRDVDLIGTAEQKDRSERLRDWYAGIAEGATGA